MTRPAAPDLHGPVGGALAVGSSRMGGLRRGRRVPGRLGFLGVVRRVALTLAVVQSATSAVLAGEAASGAALHDVSDGAHDGSPGATSVPVTAHTTADGSFEQKCNWAFQMYDLNGDGEIEFKEMKRRV